MQLLMKPSRSLSVVVIVAIGCSSASGSVFSVGGNSFGQLGLGFVDRGDGCQCLPSLQQVTESDLADVDFVQSASCGYFTILLDSNGTAYGMGMNDQGQLGIGYTKLAVSVPTRVLVVDASPIVKVATGYEHSLFLHASGLVYAAGSNRFGQLGLGYVGTAVVFPDPVVVVIPSGTVLVDIAAGLYHNIALDNQGRIWAWGYNQRGQLGLPLNPDPFAGFQRVPSPTVVPTSFRPASVSAAEQQSAILDVDGRVWMCGSNLWGQLGQGYKNQTSCGCLSTFTLFGGETLASTRVALVHAADDYTLVVTAEGQMFGVGRNHNGQLCLGYDSKSEFDPSVLTLKPAIGLTGRVSQLASGDDQTIVLDQSGRAFVCGYNNYGQLGQNYTGGWVSTPVEVLYNGSSINASYASAGFTHAVFTTVAPPKPPTTGSVPATSEGTTASEPRTTRVGVATSSEPSDLTTGSTGSTGSTAAAADVTTGLSDLTTGLASVSTGLAATSTGLPDLTTGPAGVTAIGTTGLAAPDDGTSGVAVVDVTTGVVFVSTGLSDAPTSHAATSVGGVSTGSTGGYGTSGSPGTTDANAWTGVGSTGADRSTGVADLSTGAVRGSTGVGGSPTTESEATSGRSEPATTASLPFTSVGQQTSAAQTSVVQQTSAAPSVPQTSVAQPSTGVVTSGAASTGSSVAPPSTGQPVTTALSATSETDASTGAPVADATSVVGTSGDVGTTEAAETTGCGATTGEPPPLFASNCTSGSDLPAIVINGSHAIVNACDNSSLGSIDVEFPNGTVVRYNASDPDWPDIVLPFPVWVIIVRPDGETSPQIPIMPPTTAALRTSAGQTTAALGARTSASSASSSTAAAAIGTTGPFAATSAGQPATTDVHAGSTTAAPRPTSGAVPTVPTSGAPAATTSVAASRTSGVTAIGSTAVATGTTVAALVPTTGTTAAAAPVPTTAAVVQSTTSEALPTPPVPELVPYVDYIEVSWNSVVMRRRSAAELNVTLEMSSSGADFVPVFSVFASSFAHNVTGLEPNSTYAFRVWTASGGARSDYSAVVSVETFVDPTQFGTTTTAAPRHVGGVSSSSSSGVFSGHAMGTSTLASELRQSLSGSHGTGNIALVAGLVAMAFVIILVVIIAVVVIYRRRRRVARVGSMRRTIDILRDTANSAEMRSMTSSVASTRPGGSAATSAPTSDSEGENAAAQIAPAPAGNATVWRASLIRTNTPFRGRALFVPSDSDSSDSDGESARVVQGPRAPAPLPTRAMSPVNALDELHAIVIQRAWRKQRDRRATQAWLRRMRDLSELQQHRTHAKKSIAPHSLPSLSELAEPAASAVPPSPPPDSRKEILSRASAAVEVLRQDAVAIVSQCDLPTDSLQSCQAALEAQQFSLQQLLGHVARQQKLLDDLVGSIAQSADLQHKAASALVPLKLHQANLSEVCRSATSHERAVTALLGRLEQPADEDALAAARKQTQQALRAIAADVSGLEPQFGKLTACLDDIAEAESELTVSSLAKKYAHGGEVLRKSLKRDSRSPPAGTPPKKPSPTSSVAHSPRARHPLAQQLTCVTGSLQALRDDAALLVSQCQMPLDSLDACKVAMERQQVVLGSLLKDIDDEQQHMDQMMHTWAKAMEPHNRYIAGSNPIHGQQAQVDDAQGWAQQHSDTVCSLLVTLTETAASDAAEAVERVRLEQKALRADSAAFDSDLDAIQRSLRDVSEMSDDELCGKVRRKPWTANRPQLPHFQLRRDQPAQPTAPPRKGLQRVWSFRSAAQRDLDEFVATLERTLDHMRHSADGASVFEQTLLPELRNASVSMLRTLDRVRPASYDPDQSPVVDRLGQLLSQLDTLNQRYLDERPDFYGSWRQLLIDLLRALHRETIDASWLLARSAAAPARSFSGDEAPESDEIMPWQHGSSAVDVHKLLKAAFEDAEYARMTDWADLRHKLKGLTSMSNAEAQALIAELNRRNPKFFRDVRADFVRDETDHKIDRNRLKQAFGFFS
eukprot:TRINITY_DN4848_c0_g1_i2.p1 TRINITY_DN4848_c0_g1~~TRINITY_DN4848_c0_g1_i2.p1  ORF type:complete len:1991 (-),score=624.09 TRINITY_DN4848_c0_g1_i2:485-6457(-)